MTLFLMAVTALLSTGLLVLSMHRPAAQKVAQRSRR